MFKIVFYDPKLVGALPTIQAKRGRWRTQRMDETFDGQSATVRQSIREAGNSARCSKVEMVRLGV